MESIVCYWNQLFVSETITSIMQKTGNSCLTLFSDNFKWIFLISSIIAIACVYIFLIVSGLGATFVMYHNTHNITTGECYDKTFTCTSNICYFNLDNMTGFFLGCIPVGLLCLILAVIVMVYGIGPLCTICTLGSSIIVGILYIGVKILNIGEYIIPKQISSYETIPNDTDADIVIPINSDTNIPLETQ